MSCTILVDDLDAAIEQYRAKGYRLDMIRPADAPSEALVLKDSESIRLVVENHRAGEAQPQDRSRDWVKGRAGMEYRDLTPDRMRGKIIASQIRLTEAGEVPDYVHYHKIGFQIIYCTNGRINVVYEDQGPPFWLEAGDCVLQPPEIRHRVLECTAGAEVIEVSMPAEHETWVEYELSLPTPVINPDRDFNGQRFIRSIAAGAEWLETDVDGFEKRHTLIGHATKGVADVYVLRAKGRKVDPPVALEKGSLCFPTGSGESLVVSVPGVTDA